jgi:hypothetical protein
MDKKLQELVEKGVPIKKAVFVQTVTSSGGNKTPEFAFYSPEPGLIKSREADMWLTSFGLVCVQSDGVTIVPHANIAYSKAK